MAQFHWDPDAYLELMRQEVPGYEALQEALVRASAGAETRAILELGVGSGETTRRLLDAHPNAHITGLDASAEMLEAARQKLPGERVTLEEARMEDPLPAGPYDLVATALAVHHLDGPAKADLFRRVAAVLRPGGRFVLADVVVPVDPADVVTPIDGEYDMPSSVDEQLRWLGAANLSPRVAWARRDLAVLTGDRSA
jgi:tRNA (cmo5U34)-methyltransferase